MKKSLDKKTANGNSSMNVWNYLRYGFWTMVALFVINAIISYFKSTNQFVVGISFVIELLFYASLIFVFVNSIRHLMKYEHKTFAIVALCISSFLLLTLYVIVLLTAVASLAQF